MSASNSHVSAWGDYLDELCSGARIELILVAPFVKASVLEKLLAEVPHTAAVSLVTRWRVEEIVSGVSDLEVWPLLQQRAGSSIYLRPDLHAKYYRADERCLVGSANLTAAALGWREAANLELLVELPRSDPGLVAFECDLFTGSLLATQDLYEQVRELVADVEPLDTPPTVMPELVRESGCVPYSALPTVDRSAWLPRLRNPEDLYVAYSGKHALLSTASRDAAIADLLMLPIVPRLPRPVFDRAVAVLLLQAPIVQAVDAFVAAPQRFGAVRDLLSRLPCASVAGFDANWGWQTLMRWLRHFLPERYALAVPRHSEIFVRKPGDSGNHS